MRMRKPAGNRVILGLIGASVILAAPVSAQTRPVSVHRAGEPRPAVNHDMGRVTTHVCLWSRNASSIVEEAVSKLKGKAEAMGASALVDLRYRMIDNHPRAGVCHRFLRAEATAAHLDGALAEADAPGLR